jgi:hypothetical protein
MSVKALAVATKVYDLACPCGKPLEVGRMDDQWVIGHLSESCSPLIRAKTIDGAFRALIDMLLHTGHYLNLEEYLKEKAKLNS